MKLTLTVEVDVLKNEIYSKETLRQDLIGEWVKVKSGLYENQIVGTITELKENK